jgi:hypothetical protein
MFWGLHVLVLAPVGVVQPLGHLAHDVDGELDRVALSARRLGPEDLGEVPAVHVLHGDEVGVVGPAEVEDLDDVGVAQGHRDLRLVDEHVDEGRVLAELGEDALDDDELLEALHAVGLRLVYLGHPAPSDELEELVLAVEEGGPARHPPRTYIIRCPATTVRSAGSGEASQAWSAFRHPMEITSLPLTAVDSRGTGPWLPAARGPGLVGPTERRSAAEAVGDAPRGRPRTG